MYYITVNYTVLTLKDIHLLRFFRSITIHFLYRKLHFTGTVRLNSIIFFFSSRFSFISLIMIICSVTVNYNVVTLKDIEFYPVFLRVLQSIFFTPNYISLEQSVDALLYRHTYKHTHLSFSAHNGQTARAIEYKCGIMTATDRARGMLSTHQWSLSAALPLFMSQLQLQCL